MSPRDDTSEAFANLSPLDADARAAAPTQVLRILRNRIVGGEIPAGVQLPSELALAGQLGVSKPVVREAMKVLAAQGFVTVRHGRGTTVNSQTDWNVFDPEVLLALGSGSAFEHLNDARRIIEPAIAYRAAENATPEDVAAMREVLLETRGSIDEHVRTDVEFHRRVARATQNPILVIVLDSLTPLLNEGRRLMYDMEDAVESALLAHRDIYEAIAAGEGLAAQAAMTAHIDDVSTRLNADTIRAHEGDSADPAPST